MSLFLTPEQLAQLTGRRTRPAQERELRRRGYICERNAKGDIVVSASHVEAKLGANSTNDGKTAPDFTSLERLA
jgi:hypothetical protein